MRNFAVRSEDDLIDEGIETLIICCSRLNALRSEDDLIDEGIETPLVLFCSYLPDPFGR